jgi:L-amino acid N-acyltransferase YncA
MASPQLKPHFVSTLLHATSPPATRTSKLRAIRHDIEEGVSDAETPQPDDLRDRRKNLRSRRFPHLVATRGGEVLGYAYVVLFRKRPAYRYTVKHSIYIHHAHVGQGIGQILMRELIGVCAAAGFRQIIGYIDADNTASLGLHEKFGFSRVGLLQASPIGTAAGPIPSWFSARSLPDPRPLHLCRFPNASQPACRVRHCLR